MRAILPLTLLAAVSIAAVVSACSDDDSGGGTTNVTDAGTGNDTGASTDAAAQQDTAAAQDTGTAEAGGKPFGETCNLDSDCESNACFKGGSQQFCSIKCDKPADCPVPPTSGQCNNQGYCRKP